MIEDQGYAQEIEAHFAGIDIRFAQILTAIAALKLAGATWGATGREEGLGDHAVGGQGITGVHIASSIAAAGGGESKAEIVTLLVSGGSDLNGWLARAEQIFDLHGTLETQRMDLAMVAMEGTVVGVVPLVTTTGGNFSWQEISQAIVRRFDTRHTGNPYERLEEVRQQGTVEAYID